MSDKKEEDPRQPYEPPRLFSLGGSVAYAAKKCNQGSVAGMGRKCQPGAVAANKCQPGSSAGYNCGPGGAATSGRCNPGSAPAS